MEALTIDCKTGKQTKRQFMPAEVAQRKIDTVQAIVGEKVLRQKQGEHQKVIERVRRTELGRDILTILGIEDATR